VEFLSAHRRHHLADIGLSVLVVVLLLDVVVLAPLVELGVVNRHVAQILFVLILLGGVAALSWHNVLARLFLVASLGCAGIRIANLALPDASLRVWDASFSLAALVLLASLVLWQVFSAGRMTVHRVLGAIAAYLLIGLAFAQVYRLIAQQAPGAFLIGGTPADYDAVVTRLQYFSFVALTSLGFGDITPAHPLARSVTVFETLLGVLYPAVLIGRLVTLEPWAGAAGAAPGPPNEST
jgi:hypothetical protein